MLLLSKNIIHSEMRSRKISHHHGQPYEQQPLASKVLALMEFLRWCSKKLYFFIRFLGCVSHGWAAFKLSNLVGFFLFFIFWVYLSTWFTEMGMPGRMLPLQSPAWKSILFVICVIIITIVMTCHTSTAFVTESF